MSWLYPNIKKRFSVLVCSLALGSLVAVSIGCGGSSSTNPPTSSPLPTPTDSTPAETSGMPVPPGNANVPQPSGTPGNLNVVDWAGFKGAVSYTFDDVAPSQVANYTALNALGVRMTFYIWTNQIGSDDQMVNMWKQVAKDGHELGNHTKNHWKLENVQKWEDLAADTEAATVFMKEKLGVTPLTMAAPYGDPAYQKVAPEKFFINRGLGNNEIAPNDATDPYALPCYLPASTDTAAILTAEANKARQANKWKIFLVHGFKSENQDWSYLPIELQEFTSSVGTVKGYGDTWIDSVVNIGAYWVAQKMISQLIPTQSGADLVYSWTLPANFPPGKYLRVKVDGGILKQGGKVLEWDKHGYYEIALDDRSLTLSPNAVQ